MIAKLLRASVVWASPFGGRASLLTASLPPAKGSEEFGNGEIRSWNLLGQCGSFYILMFRLKI